MFDLIFWGIVLVVAFAGIKQKFLCSFCSAIAIMLAFYFSFWELEPVTALTALLPVNIGDLARPLAFILLFAISFFFFKQLLLIPEHLLEKNHPEEEEIFSGKLCYCGTFLANLFSGAILATMLFTAVAVTPAVKTIPQLAAPEITTKAMGGIRFVTGLVDTLTWQKKYPQERDCLMRKSFGQLSPEEAQIFKDFI